MIPIFIPTYGRVHAQKTWDNLPTVLRLNTGLVVHEMEAENHKRLKRNVLVCPVQGTGVGPVRQWILDYAFSQCGISKYILIDDDVKIQVRDERFKIWDASPEQMVEAVEWMEDQLDVVPTCGLSARSLGYDTPGDFMEPGRQVAVHGVNTRLMKKIGVDYMKDAPVGFSMEDFYATLQCLVAGYPNRISLKYRYTNSVSNAPGGWSIMRTLDTQNMSAEFLASKFPQFVKVRTKNNVWQGMNQPSKDVTIFWKKALEHGRRAR